MGRARTPDDPATRFPDWTVSSTVCPFATIVCGDRQVGSGHPIGPVSSRSAPLGDEPGDLVVVGGPAHLAPAVPPVLQLLHQGLRLRLLQDPGDVVPDQVGRVALAAMVADP